MKPAQLDRPFPPRVPAAADTERDTLSAWDAVYALNMAIACSVIYWVITGLLYGFVDQASDFLRGMWAVVMALSHRRDDTVTTGMTTAVVMVVAAMASDEAWRQPLLRPFDTVVGIGLGVIFKWIGSYLFFLGERQHDRRS
jgi:hypothetical protein